MLKLDHTKQFANAARVGIALCALAALGGGAASAQVEITNQSQLGAFTFTTAPYQGASGTTVPSPVTATAGLTTLALTDTMGSVFSRLDATAGSGLDVASFGTGTTLLQTADANSKSLGPLQIDFSTPAGNPAVGVAGFGFKVQNFAFANETFMLTVFTNGATTGGTVLAPYGPFDNNNANGNTGQAVFVGALSTTGNTITRAIISSVASDAQGPITNFNDNFFFSPITITNVPQPVPEASTFVGVGMGALLFAGMLVSTRRRKGSQATQSVA